MFLHAPSRLVQTILDGMAHACEALQIWRIKTEEGWVFSSLDYERILQIDHERFSPIPAAFKVA